MFNIKKIVVLTYPYVMSCIVFATPITLGYYIGEILDNSRFSALDPDNL